MTIAFKIIIITGGFLSAFSCFGQIEKKGGQSKLLERFEYYVNKIPSGIRNNSNFSKARYYFNKSNYDSTIIYSARFQNSQSKPKRLVDYNHFMRGVCFIEKGLVDEAMDELNRIDSTFTLYPAVQSRKAGLYMFDSEFDKSLKLLFELSEKKNLEKYGVERYAIDRNIGGCYLGKGNFELGEKYMLQSLEYEEAQKDTSFLILTYSNLANTYYTQYLDDEAYQYFLKAFELANQTKDYILRMNSSLNLAVFEENRSDFEKSLNYRKQYDRWKDSTNNQEKVWEIAQIEKQHLAETKQKEIGLLQRKNKLIEQENELKSKERNAILVGSAVLLLVLILIIYFYYQKIRSSAIISEQRESLDKLNAFKNRLFSIVSHDLRSSVHGLRRSTEQLRSEIPNEDSKLKALVNQQGAIANSTYGMLDNLLNWALLQSDEIYFHPEKVSLKRLIPQVVLNYQPLLDQKKIALELDIPKDAKVLADVDSVKIVLRNVLDNAIKFTPEEGKLSISAEILEDQCHLRIKDNGSGMSPEQLAIVLEQSSQVSKESDEERSGTGLGVRLCASFMSKNNGSFRIESEKEEGTTVILSFEKA